MSLGARTKLAVGAARGRLARRHLREERVLLALLVAQVDQLPLETLALVVPPLALRKHDRELCDAALAALLGARRKENAAVAMRPRSERR